jgi:hypothetical protein
MHGRTLDRLVGQLETCKVCGGIRRITPRLPSFPHSTCSWQRLWDGLWNSQDIRETSRNKDSQGCKGNEHHTIRRRHIVYWGSVGANCHKIQVHPRPLFRRLNQNGKQSKVSSIWLDCVSADYSSNREISRIYSKS